MEKEEKVRIYTIHPKKVTWGGWHTRYGDDLLIKVDADYPKGLIRKMVRYHEIREDHYMQDLGMNYEDAHEAANHDEIRRFGRSAFNHEVAYTRAVLKGNR